MSYDHQVEFAMLSGDPQDLANLCAMLNKRSTEGFDCIAILPVTLGNMTMANGVLVAEKPKQALAAVLRGPKKPGLKCVFCGRESKYTETLPLMHRTEDEFYIETPTCEHGNIVLCKECLGKGCQCPVCGCREFYT